MTLWHQRLLIFFGKILAAIAVIVSVVFLLYYNFYFKKDNLIKYVPKRAVIYVNFRLDQEFLKVPLIQRLQSELPLPVRANDLVILNPLVSNNASLAIVPSQATNLSQLDYLLIFSLKETDGRLNSYYAALDRLHWQHLIISNLVLNRKVLVLSNSANLIEEVRQISRQEKPSLADKVDLILNLSKFKIGYLGKIYIDAGQFLKMIAGNNDPKLDLLNALLSDQKINDLYLGLKIKDLSFVLETREAVTKQTKEPLLIGKVPSDFDLSFSFSNLTSSLRQGIQKLAQNNSLLYLQIQNNREYVENLAGFSFEQDILPLFSNQAQIVLTQDQKFILAVKTSEVTDLAGKLNKLEQIIIQYLAIKNPVFISKKLPDNTYISELTKQPNNIEFNEKEVAGIKLKQVQENNEEFAYFMKENVLFLSNSSQKIEKLLQDKDLIDLEAKQNKYNTTNFSENLVVNPNILKNLLPVLGNLSQITIFEDWLNNGNIRLILE